jgi:penicillin amidase
LGNITDELSIGRAVARIGSGKVKELLWFHPGDPDISLDSAVKGDLLFENILDLYNAFRRDLIFEPGDIKGIVGGQPKMNQLNKVSFPQENGRNIHEFTFLGSNNWVVNGNLTESGFPIMANDPHRKIMIPSLRYIVHLVAPDWNVIGGGEPELPGISIGHNDHGAWGLTVFRTDGEDLYVYDLNSSNLNQYKYRNQWEDMILKHETIKVSGCEDVHVILRYTRHGPVTYIDSVNHRAYAVRCAWLEPGGSPYLASLRMDQAENWEEFRDACNYSHIPGENMVWTDKDQHIGWQAVGIAPIRRNFSGLVPVPGDGRYEWDGYLPIREKPHLFNPESSFIATANQNVTPESYKNWNAIGFLWADPFRGDRINEVLGSGEKLSLEDIKTLQTDYYSIPARILVPLLKQISFMEEKLNQAKEIVSDWNFILDKNSIAAGIYVIWENRIIEMAEELFIPEEVKGLISLQLSKIIDWVLHPEIRFGPDPEIGRNEFIYKTFVEAINHLTLELGENMQNWQYGQEHYKHVHLNHPLSFALGNEWKSKLNCGPAPRGGNGYTLCATGGNNNQTSGASFRIIVDTGDWDKSVGINTPGQSGNPESQFYKNLFNSWANDQYFPLYYSREKIENIMVEKFILGPLENE